MTEIVTSDAQSMALLEQVVIGGDLSKLSPKDRLTYYSEVCRSVGLNPLTKPFEYITLNSKLVLYAKRDATDQLRALKGISIRIVSRELLGEIYVVTAQAKSTGREDESTGAVAIAGLKGADLANAYMKAETKAKRRVTLSIAGLGMLDESEVGDVDPDTATAHELTGMDPAQYAMFEGEIADLTDRAASEALWKRIAAACYEVKDKAANDALKSKITAKVATLREKAA
jgi:hypothetical protein